MLVVEDSSEGMILGMDKSVVRCEVFNEIMERVDVGVDD